MLASGKTKINLSQADLGQLGGGIVQGGKTNLTRQPEKVYNNSKYNKYNVCVTKRMKIGGDRRGKPPKIT